MSDATTIWLGPVEHLVLQVEPGTAPDAGLDLLRAAEASGAIRLLDLEVVERTDDGVAALDIGAWGDQQGLDLHDLDGLWSGLLDDEDLQHATESLGEGAVAVVIVYELTALDAAIAAWSDAGVPVITAGPVLEADLLDALDLPAEPDPNEVP